MLVYEYIYKGSDFVNKIVGTINRRNINFALKQSYDYKEESLIYWLKNKESIKDAYVFYRYCKYYKKWFSNKKIHTKTEHRRQEILDELTTKLCSIRECKGYHESNWNTNFWTFRGYTLEESKIKVFEAQKNNGKKSVTYFRNLPENERKTKKNIYIEYYLNKGYSLEESKKLLSKRQRTFSLDICIEKYGKEKGTQIWQDRQSKWQNTLKSKPQDEIDRINKSKVTYIIPINQMKDKDIYYMLVNRITKKQNIELLKDYDKRSKYGYHLDHIISKAYGFKHNIPPYIIGDISNLQMLLTNENTSKKSKCYSVIEQCSHIKDL